MKTDLTPAQQRAAWLIGMLTAVVVLVVGYAVLAPRTSGNVASGFLGGGLVVLGLVIIDRIRHSRGSDLGPAGRWAAGSPDERDDRILTRSLAIVGYVAITGLAVATVLALVVELDAAVALTISVSTLLATLIISFVVISRRS